MDTILSFDGVSKEFKAADGVVTALEDISFSMPRGATCALLGPSGSGKTTLLSLAAGLDDASTGRVLFCGNEWSGMDEDRRAALRLAKSGFVFQSFQLIGTLNAMENVMVPLDLVGAGHAGDRGREILERVGLGRRLHHYPSQLSGGEQQRVAIARAFVNRPAVLFADEPTGNLDRDSATRVMDLLFDINREQGTTLLLVTHDHDLAARCDMRLALRGGRLADDGDGEAKP